MTRPKPKFGYHARHLLSSYERRTYDARFVEELSARYNIDDPDLVRDLHEFLEGAADIYRTYTHNFDNAPRPGQMKAAYDEIDQLLEKLTDRLENLDDRSAWFFWEPESRIEASVKDPILAEDRQPIIGESPWGHRILHYPVNEGGWITSYLKRDQHFESVRILRNYCSYARKRVGKDARGPSPSEGLRMWIVNVANYWDKGLGRQFTLDYEKGQPISEAARFCIDTIRIVDPEVLPSAVFGAMKKEIAARRKKPTGNVSAK